MFNCFGYSAYIIVAGFRLFHVKPVQILPNTYMPHPHSVKDYLFSSRLELYLYHFVYHWLCVLHLLYFLKIDLLLCYLSLFSSICPNMCKNFFSGYWFVQTWLGHTFQFCRLNVPCLRPYQLFRSP